MAAPLQHQDQKIDAPAAVVAPPQYNVDAQQQLLGAAPQQQYVAPQQQPQPIASQDLHQNGVGAQPHVNGTDGVTPVAAHPTKSGPIDNNDIEGWKQKFNAALVDPAATIKASSPADSREWDSSFCGCCSPLDACK